MTYLELINNADFKLSHNQITFGEYNKMIEPLRTEIPKKGKWIEVFVKTPNDPYNYGFKPHKCSKCECRPLQISNYCPNCGAEMNGGEEDEISN